MIRSRTRSVARLVCCLSLVVPLVVFARFGGGHHYHSSSHHSSSHSYSHHSYSHHSSSSPWSSSHHSHSHGYGYTSGSGYGSGGGSFGFCGGLLVLLMFVCVVLYFAYKIKQHQNAASESDSEFPSAPDPLANEVNEENDGTSPVALLKKTDPSFDLQALLHMAKQVFLRAQLAWSSRDLDPIRSLMSDASFQRFSTQLSLMKAQNVRNVTADVVVKDAGLAGVAQSEGFDTVHIRIEAALRDVDLPWETPDAQAREAARKARVTDFVEYWSFVRKPGATTKPSSGVLEGKCPNCGAPFKGGASNKCDYCGAVVNSGNYDWTLSEITQSSEIASARRAPQGLSALHAVDPAFNLEMLEDRASLIFWKWVEARSEGRPELLSKLALLEQSSALRQEISERESRGKRQLFGECAVGAVNTLSLTANDYGQQAVVEVRWSARMGEAPKAGPPPEFPPRALGSRFTLARGAGAKTNTENGMSTNRCPNCSAPLSDSESRKCDFCGNPLASGKDDWVLARISTVDLDASGGSWDEGEPAA